MGTTCQSILLSHFTKAPLGPIRSRPQEDREYKSRFDKPRGLWVSVDGEDDWQRWCQSEMPQWMENVRRYRITLVESPRVLVLTSPCDLYDLQRQYGKRAEDRWQETYIDWHAVACEHHGIIIAPYQWSCRMEIDWYYGWDCASGCIWNADAIARVEECREAA